MQPFNLVLTSLVLAACPGLLSPLVVSSRTHALAGVNPVALSRSRESGALSHSACCSCAVCRAQGTITRVPVRTA